VERVPSQTLRVHAHRHVGAVAEVTLDQGDMALSVRQGPIADDHEVAEGGRHCGLGHTLDERLVLSPVRDEVGHGDHLEFVSAAVIHEIGHSGHSPVLVHDLADDTGRREAGQPCQIDSGLGLPCPLKHSSRLRLEREDMPEVRRAAVGINGDPNRARTVSGGDTPRDAVAGVNGHGEGRLEHRLVLGGHEGKGQFVTPLRGERDRSAQRPSRAMKLIASGVAKSAATVRSPSFSRSSSSQTTTIRPRRMSSIASSMSAKGGRLMAGTVERQVAIVEVE